MNQLILRRKIILCLVLLLCTSIIHNDNQQERIIVINNSIKSAGALVKDMNLSIADASFIGEAEDDKAGSCLVRAGDVNDDGYDDILIGVHNNDEGIFRAGQTYLIFGKDSGWAMDVDLSNADASFHGEAMSDDSGFSVAGAGDVNGDGYDDILIGAPCNGEWGYQAGKAYLIFGKGSGWAMDVNLSNAAEASFHGEYGGDQAGYCVAGAGDVNDDGYDDILIGAWGNDDHGPDTGQTYLIFGKNSGWSVNVNLSNSNASFFGEGLYDWSGIEISKAGDVNGDNHDDILIGVSRNDDRGLDAGKTYLIFGKDSEWSMDVNLSNADASFRGEYADDKSGFSVAGVGDVNGDGYDDILIGAPYGGLGNKGRAYLIFGKGLGWAMDVSLSNANIFFRGEADDDNACLVAGAGDVNGDGYDDILIGVPSNDEWGIISGQVYLIYGKGSGWAMDVDLSNADASFHGECGGDYAGSYVAGAGDVNDDGYDDILICANSNDQGTTDTGKVYLFFGSLSNSFNPPNQNDIPGYPSFFFMVFAIASTALYVLKKKKSG